MPTARLLESTRVDMVIVGAGITGALVAEAATTAGLVPLVLDRRDPGHGSTAASTGLLQFEMDVPLVQLVQEIGLERASRAWRRSFRSVSDLADLVARLEIPCGFEPRRAIYLAGNMLDAHALAEEGRLRRSIDLPSEYLDPTQLLNYAGIGRDGALVSDNAAHVDPMSLTVGLLLRAAARGCQVISPSELAEVVPSERGVQMVTSDGREIEARSLVFATGYELAKGVPTSGHRRTSTWAFATAPQPDLRVRGNVIWEAADPYLYVRNTPDGRLIVGGEDEDIDDETERDRLIAAKIQTLRQKVSELLPWLDATPEYAWAGTFGESQSGLPSIGQVPGMPHCYAVLGYGGNGITFSMIAAQIIKAFLLGARDPDADLFAFDR